MKVITQQWLKSQLDTCANRFETGDDFESVERDRILTAFYGIPSKRVKGRSNVVSRDFSTTIESLMPELVKPFVSRNDSFFKLQATTADMSQHAEYAEQAIRYILRKNDEYKLLTNWIKTSLIYSIGVCKFYVDNNTKVITHCYEDLTEEELDDILYTINEKEEVIPRDNITIINEVEEKDDGLFNVMIQETVESSPNIKIEAIEPQEFLYPASINDIKNTPICAHQRYMNDYDLINRGFDADVVKRHTTSYTQSIEEQQKERKSTEAKTEALGKKGNFVKVTEAYIRSEDSGEMRQVIAFGDEMDIIKDDPWPYRLPFAILTPFMMPNQISGLGLWNLLEDVQEINTQLLRQGLDNHTKSNDVKYLVKESVDAQELAKPGAGGFVECDDPHNDVVALQVNPISNNVLTWYQTMKEIREERAGPNKAMSGIDPNVLAGVSNIAAAQMVKSGTNKIEYIARTFAETGMQDLVLGLLEIIHMAYPEGMEFSGDNDYIHFIPNNDEIFDYEITVGLGTVGEEQHVAYLQMIAEKQKEALLELGLNNQIAPLTSYIQTYHEMLRAVGFKNPEKYFSIEGAAMTEQLPAGDESSDPLVEAQIVEAQSRMKIAEDRHLLDLEKLKFEQEELNIKKEELAIKRADLERKKLDDFNKAAVASEKLEIEEKKIEKD